MMTVVILIAAVDYAHQRQEQCDEVFTKWPPPAVHTDIIFV
jgi:hypothetical protein